MIQSIQKAAAKSRALATAATAVTVLDPSFSKSCHGLANQKLELRKWNRIKGAQIT